MASVLPLPRGGGRRSAGGATLGDCAERSAEPAQQVVGSAAESNRDGSLLLTAGVPSAVCCGVGAGERQSCITVCDGGLYRAGRAGG